MKIDLTQFYICWSPNLLSIILDNGFILWKDPNDLQKNPFVYIKPRYSKSGELLNPTTGYIFERTPELMELVKKYSNKSKLKS